MKPTLQLRISQHLTLTPQVQQAIRLLQLSTLDMHQEVARILDENPMLEQAEDSATVFAPETMPVASQTGTDEPGQTRADEYGVENFRADTFDNGPGDWNSGGGIAHSTDDEDATYPEQAAEQASLRAHLQTQLTTSTLDSRDRNVVGLLIDALDENGYLAQNLNELMELLPAASTASW